MMNAKVIGLFLSLSTLFSQKNGVYSQQLLKADVF